MTAHTDPFGIYRNQPTLPNPTEDDLKRWVGKITLWCATRTTYIFDDTDDEDGIVVGEELAERLNWLPTELLADFRTTQGRDPTPREMFDRYQKELRIAGFEWDADQERPEPWGDDKATVLVSFDEATMDRGRAYHEYGIEIGTWLNEYTVEADNDDCWPWRGLADYQASDPGGSPSDTVLNPHTDPEVWEVLTPPRKKARPFPGRPAHWPHRNARRTRARRRNNHKGGSR
jgi:hypothetical protein